MKRLYTSTAAKLFLFLLAAACTVGAVLFVCEALSLANQGCAPHEPYENSQVYRDATSVYLLAAADLYHMQGEDRSALSFVEQQERQLQQDALADLLQAENTNFRFSILTSNGKTTLYSNLSQDESFESLSITPQYAAVQQGTMSVTFPDNYRTYYSADEGQLYSSNVIAERYDEDEFDVYSYFPTDAAVQLATLSDTAPTAPTASADNYILSYGLLPGYPTDDSLAQVYQWYRNRSQQLPAFLLLAVLCALLAIVSLVLVCCGAGRRRSSDGVVMRLFDRIPFELVLALLILAAALGAPVCQTLLYNYQLGYYDATRPLIIGGYLSYILVIAELGVLTTAVRVKGRAFWRHTLLGRLVGLCSNMVNHLSMTWKCVLFYLIYEAVCLMIGISSDCLGLFFLLAIVNFFLLLASCRWVVKFSAVRDGAAELAKGNLEYRIPTTHLPKTLKDHATDLNHISEGMSAAVEERMKSERLKSELITNVSHDIKTPLTSIINYVDLLCAEPIEDPKIREYLSVLDRQSKRLKKLANDLVEASKASSGALAVHAEAVDACELLQQATGEYSERLSAGHLTPVFSLPEHPVYIYADGALLWRVIDNLLSNICKYAMPGTRVYLTAESDGETLQLSIKNISRAALNIPVEELTERFVRGDSSRNSEIEGSGLGLSIARSLMQLMGGTFTLDIDGDLFKASLSFPVIDKPKMP